MSRLLDAVRRLNDMLLVRKVSLVSWQISRKKKPRWVSGVYGLLLLSRIQFLFQRTGCGGLLLFFTVLLIVDYSYYYLIRFFWLRCLKIRFRIALHHRNLFVRTNI